MAALAAAAAARADTGFKLLELGGHTVKWGQPVAGKGAVVRYRIAFDGTTPAGRENCRKTSNLDALLIRAAISRDDFRRAAENAFAMWSAAADIRFVPAAAGHAADITVAAEAVDDGIAYTDVVRLRAKAEHMASLSRAIVCLNPAATWTSGDAAPQGTYRLSYVLAHEIGHTIGLDHPSPTGVLMSFEYDPERSGLAAGDVEGAMTLYGPAARRRIVSAH